MEKEQNLDFMPKRYPPTLEGRVCGHFLPPHRVSWERPPERFMDLNCRKNVTEVGRRLGEQMHEHEISHEKFQDYVVRITGDDGLIGINSWAIGGIVIHTDYSGVGDPPVPSHWNVEINGKIHKNFSSHIAVPHVSEPLYPPGDARERGQFTDYALDVYGSDPNFGCISVHAPLFWDDHHGQVGSATYHSTVWLLAYLCEMYSPLDPYRRIACVCDIDHSARREDCSLCHGDSMHDLIGHVADITDEDDHSSLIQMTEAPEAYWRRQQDETP